MINDIDAGLGRFGWYFIYILFVCNAICFTYDTQKILNDCTKKITEVITDGILIHEQSDEVITDGMGLPPYCCTKKIMEEIKKKK